MDNWNWPEPVRNIDMVRWGIHYLDLGWNVMPIEASGKRPRLASWERFQTERVTQEMVEEWWTRWPLANIALICGRISGVVCLDIDDASRCEFAFPSGKLPVTATSQTARGYHHFFQYPQGGFPSFKGDGFDVQSDGKYVIIPPSEHSSGKIYLWNINPWGALTPFADIPAFLLSRGVEERKLNNASTSGVIRPLFDMDGYFQGVGEGKRNSATARLAGYLFSRDRDYEEVLCAVQGWNLRNFPPLHPAEIKQVVDSVYKKHGNGRETR